MRLLYWIATLSQFYIVPLFLIQLFLLTGVSKIASLVVYTKSQEMGEEMSKEITGPPLVEEMINQISFVPIQNLVLLMLLIPIGIYSIRLKKDEIAIMMIKYNIKMNPLMKDITDHHLKNLEELHHVELLKDDEDGFGKKGKHGLVIEETEGNYDILIPYESIVTMKKEDVRDVAIETNSKY